MLNGKLQNIFGVKCYQYFAAVTASLSILSSEMHFGWPSPSLPVLFEGTYFFKISSAEGSWLAVAIFPGIACGALLACRLTGVLGRKKVILGSAFPLFFSWMLLALAREDMLMFIARFLGGFGGGLSFATVPMYLGEISEPRHRGFLSSLCPVSVVFGILLINILGIYLPINLAAYIASVIPVLMFMTFFWMPESPVFLLTLDEKEKAINSLTILRGAEDGAKEFQRLSEEFAENDIKTPFNMFDLFKEPVNRKALSIVIFLRTIQQISGSTAITFYCNIIFLENEGFISANLATIIYFTVQAILALCSSVLLDRVGRRPMFIISLLGTIATLILLGSYFLVDKKLHFNSIFESVPMLVLFLNIGFFSIGVRNIPLLVLSEVFAPHIKPAGSCVVTIYYGILAIFVTMFYHHANHLFGFAVPFFTFGSLCFIALILYWKYIPETKGKTLEDIQIMLRNEHQSTDL